MQVTPPPCLVDYTAVILAAISMMGNVLLGYIAYKRGPISKD